MSIHVTTYVSQCLKKSACLFVRNSMLSGMLLGVLLLTWVPFAYSHEQHANSDAIPPASEFPQSKTRQIKGGPFNLTTHLGKKVSEMDYRGKYLLIYFGYSYCPEVCPSDLMVISKAIDLLGKDSDLVQPLFITFDPARDTKERLATYIKNFHPRLIALTGSKEQTLAAANHYGVDVSATYKAEVAGSAYSMNHSAFTYLVDPERRLPVMFRDGTDAHLMAKTIQKYLKQ